MSKNYISIWINIMTRVISVSIESWSEFSIKDICINISSGGTPSRKVPEYYLNGVHKWIKTQELKDCNIYDTDEHITDAALKNSSAKIYPKNTISMAMYGATVGKLGIMKSECATNQACCNMVVDSTKADYRFLFYSLLYRREELIGLASGAAQQNLNVGVISNFRINLPTLSEQKVIAATLSVLDDMIELNNQINKTLEDMAQAIFKSWFVDFEPFKDGEFEESELGLIPKGWRVGVLEDIAFINTETINPQNYPETFFEHFSIPLFDEGKFSAFEKGEVIKSNKYVIDSSCMLFSKLNPQFKRVFRPFCKTSKAICSTEFMVYKAKKPIYNNYIYSTLCSGSFHQFVMQNVTGTTNSRQRAIPKNTLNFKMLIPDENALSSYNQIISGIFNIMQRIPEDNKLLSSIRDTILPKLMSGEIRVPVEEVV
jgi:type I restriction enzyme S subunit